MQTSHCRRANIHSLGLLPRGVTILDRIARGPICSQRDLQIDESAHGVWSGGAQEVRQVPRRAQAPRVRIPMAGGLKDLISIRTRTGQAA